ncbi:hypothetical protein G6F40_015424 [Rhizopus arrhizus]|nr:hypothetical protein G6F40_015424 [Rhizopus arrhizus]
MQAARQPGEDHLRHLELPDDDGRRRSRRHLADTAERDDARRTPHRTHVKIAHGDTVNRRARVHRRQQIGDFFVQRAEDGETFHGVL